MIFRHFLSVIVFTLSATATADTPQGNTYQSGEQRVQLLELYTSEGCSSCPPADHWLSRQKNSGGLWKAFVPVSFHVSYWNWIGWQDKYSDKHFDERQRNYASGGTLSNVYTPGFLLNGEEWRGFFQHHKTLPKRQTESVGNLKLSLQGGNNFSASFTGNNGEQLHIAILAMGISSKVTRGENSDKTLTHDFVVVGYKNYAVDGKKWRGKLPVIEHNASQYAIAAWISGGNSQRPIQALGGEFKLQ